MEKIKPRELLTMEKFQVIMRNSYHPVSEFCLKWWCIEVILLLMVVCHITLKEFHWKLSRATKNIDYIVTLMFLIFTWCKDCGLRQRPAILIV